MILAQNHLLLLNGNKMKGIVAIFFLIIGFHSLGQHYAKIGERDGIKYYIHKVKDGETLYGIQSLYGISSDQIYEANALLESLEIGQVLYLPIRYHDVKHTVRKKETLYGISRKYSAPIDSLKAHNPSLKDGLQMGEELLIKNLILPIQITSVDGQEHSAVNLEDSVSSITANDSIIEYEVQSGETLYSISKRFMVPVSILTARNNLNTSELSLGQVITIPLKKELKIKSRPEELYVFDTLKAQENLDTFRLNREFQVVVFLPFNLDTVDTKGMRSYALEYYMGSMMAIDSLNSYAVNGNFRFVDYLSKTVSFDSLLNSYESDSIDLMYAPFDFKLSKKLADWASSHDVKVVYPLASHHSLGVQNSNAFFMNPNTSSLLAVLADYMSTKDSTQIVLIKTSDSIEIEVYEEFLQITQYLDLPIKIHEANFENYTFFAKKRGMKTAYVLLSKCSPKIDELLQFSSENDNVEVYGLKEWKRCSAYLNSIENEKAYQFANPSFLSYNDSEVMRMHRMYRSRYNSDLTKMSCLGFDATLNMFLLALYGIDLPHGLIHNFKFDNSSINYINRGAFILSYKALEENIVHP